MLKDKLYALAEKSRKNIPEPAKKIMAEATSAVQTSISARQIPNAGDPLPEFELPNSSGDQWNSKELVTNNQLVLTFFRGGW